MHLPYRALPALHDDTGNTPGPALPAKQRLKRRSLGAGTQAGDVDGGGEEPLHLDLELLRFHPNLLSYYLCDLREATSHNLVSFS